MITIYYIDDDGYIKTTIIYGDIANYDTFYHEMNETYPNGWSFNQYDLEETIIS